MGRMSQLPHTKAWRLGSQALKSSRPRESWWGALEVGGSCLERVASVKAYTDCASLAYI